MAIKILNNYCVITIFLADDAIAYPPYELLLDPNIGIHDDPPVGITMPAFAESKITV